MGGMKASKILIATPLLKWYLKHGLIVTRIYQVVENCPKRCFSKFVKNVSDARRDGDKDPNKAILASTMKLLGNSGYGSLIVDKTRQRNVFYVKGDGKAQLKINDPRFRSCTAISDDIFEIELAKRRIKLNLPFYIGYHNLQLAKLRMLEFYYDFLQIL